MVVIAFPVAPGNRSYAGANGFAVEVDGTRATEPGTAAILGASQFESVAQYPKERSIGRDVDLAFNSIDPQREFRHGPPSAPSATASDGNGNCDKGNQGLVFFAAARSRLWTYLATNRSGVNQN